MTGAAHRRARFSRPVPFPIPTLMKLRSLLFLSALAFFAPEIPAAAAPEPGTWVNVTPAAIALTGQDNYGMQDVLVDPPHPNTAYAFTCRFGVWKSTDYGLTWKKI